MITKKKQRNFNRKKPDPARMPAPTMATVTSVTASGSTQVTIVFAEAVQIAPDNLPATWLFGTGNHAITALVSATPTTYVFTVAGTVATTQAYTIPGMDPAARTSMGGYVAGKTGTLV